MKRFTIYLGGLLVIAALGTAVWMLRSASEIRSTTALLLAASSEVKAKEQEALTKLREAQGASAKLKQQALANPSGSSSEVNSVPPLGEAPWDAGQTFADVSKELLKKIQLSSYFTEGWLTPEAIALLGVTPKDAAAYHDLHVQMQTRFDELEKSHFRQTDDHWAPNEVANVPGERVTFVVPPLIEEMKLLQAEWRQGLEGILGETRTEFLFGSLTPRGMNQQPNRPAGRGPGAGPSSWLTRGTNQSRITFLFPSEPESRSPNVTITGTTDTFVSVRGDLQTTFTRGAQQGIAQTWKDWQKLITPEMVLAARSAAKKANEVR